MGNVASRDYLELVRRFPLRPIRSARELDQATEIIDHLIAQEKRSPGADDYLDVLSDLVEKYESEHHPIPDASPVDMLKFFIEDRQTNQRAVALGSGIAVSTMSEIVGGRRPMNFAHMRKLAQFFNVDVAVFLPKEKTVVVAPKRVSTKR